MSRMEQTEMTLAAWMIAQDTRRIERDARHRAALREAATAARAARGPHGVSRLVEALRDRIAPAECAVDRCVA